MNKSILITGANTGIGKELARQLALKNETEKIYLACRNEGKAKVAKQDLENITGKKIFEIIIVDVSDLNSVRNAVAALKEPIDALVMNAGGMAGKKSGKKTSDGVTLMCATNILGHALFLEEILKAKKLNRVALFASSEAGRGIPFIGMKRPKLKTSSVDDFIGICTGTHYGKKFNAIQSYGDLKYLGAMWMASMARKNTNVRIVTVSPGGTSGTEVMNSLPAPLPFIINKIGSRIMPLIGFMHKVDKGAKRFVDGIADEQYKSGVFYASKASSLTGPVIDQSSIFKDLANEQFQDNAHVAIHRFIK